MICAVCHATLPDESRFGLSCGADIGPDKRLWPPTRRGAAVPQAWRRLSAVLLGLVIGCVLPSDQSTSLRLVFNTIPAVYVGDTVQLGAHAGDRSLAGVIRPADLVFESGNPAALDVTPAGLAVARAEDTVTVTVRVRYADAPPTVAKVPVLATLRIDSIVPATQALYYGDTVTVFGVGLNPQSTTLFVGGLASQVVRFTFVPGSPGGPSSVTALVPLAASPASVTARRGQTSTTAGTKLAIVQHDRLEPNDSTPYALGVLNSIIDFPWLVLEGTTPGKVAARDWYTFNNPTSQDVTLILKPAGVASVDEISLSFTNALDASGNPLPQGWVESVAGNYCRGTVVGGYHGVLDSQVVAVAGLAPGTYQVMVGTVVPPTQALGYELRIEQGYQAALPNTYQHNAGNCASPFIVRTHQPTFPIDNPGAVAWFAITAPNDSEYYNFQLTPAFMVSGTRFVVGIPQGVLDVLRPTGQLVFEGGTDLIRECLAAGNYLLAVSDASGGTGGYQFQVDSTPSQRCQPTSIRAGAR